MWNGLIAHAKQHRKRIASLAAIEASRPAEENQPSMFCESAENGCRVMEPIADPTDRFDQFRIFTQLTANRSDVHIHRAIEYQCIIPDRGLNQFSSGERPARLT